MKGKASFTIGRVTGVHGLNGNLKVWSYAQSQDTFRPGRTVRLRLPEDREVRDNQERPYTIVKASAHKKGVLLNLEGIDTRELAEELIGQDIIIDRDQLPEPEEDTWYWEDLIGLEVIDRDKGLLGRITRIFPTGANDVLVVEDDTKETLVPMHRNFVQSVDIEQQTVRTTLPEDYE